MTGIRPLAGYLGILLSYHGNLPVFLDSILQLTRKLHFEKQASGAMPTGTPSASQGPSRH